MATRPIPMRSWVSNPPPQVLLHPKYFTSRKKYTLLFFSFFFTSFADFGFNDIARDEADAIDKSNILNERTRGSGQAPSKKPGAMREPGDEEGLPGPEDGTSSADVKEPERR